MCVCVCVCARARARLQVDINIDTDINKDIDREIAIGQVIEVVKESPRKKNTHTHTQDSPVSAYLKLGHNARETAQIHLDQSTSLMVRRWQHIPFARCHCIQILCCELGH